MAAKKKRNDTSIETYREKRDFLRTPEPAPGEIVPTPENPAFVIHRHEASHLHYDLRLEFEGVLKSFAVPKGFSYVPEHKHLAVRTEDHPLEYFDFHGVIPKGEYGAGTMKIWDRGRYQVVHHDDLGHAIQDGEIKIEMDGGRVRGQWHMVRTRKNEQGKQQWLLFKHRDQYARGEADPAFPLDLSMARRIALPRTLKPMSATPEAQAFDDPEWVFELLFRGQRVLARIEAETVRFLKPDGKVLKAKLPEVSRDLTRLRTRSAWIDGVLVAAGGDGRPDPELLAARLADGTTTDVVFYAFDLLHYDHWNLRGFPLNERKHALRAVIPNLTSVLPVDYVAERGRELMEVVEAGGLAGIVAKDRASRYSAGRSDRWVRIDATGATPSADHVLEMLESRAPQRTASQVKFSNRSKVYWPAEGVTKGELLDYYDRIADVLLPYLRDRPAHMLRYPDGIEGKWFYQKNVTGRVPDWVHTVYLGEKEGEEVRYVVINDRDTLLHLVNLGSIDLHPWHSRVQSSESPDWGLLDLDPTVDDFRKVIRVAREIGKLLRGIGLRPVLKTSGATGLHIMIPFKPGYSYEQSRMFCEAVSRIVAREMKDIATVERSVANRESKVYIDFLQNIREQTIVPPYVVRPVPGASCSAPLDWDELDFDLRREAFTMERMLERVNQLGDLFRPCLEDLQDLGPAIDALSDAL